MKTFPEALDLLQDGQRVTRRAWVSREGFDWLFLVPGSSFTVEADRPIGRAAPELVGKTVGYQHHIDRHSPDHRVAPWYPAQEDLFATDWLTVD